MFDYVSYADNATQLAVAQRGMWRTRTRVIKSIRWLRSSPAMQ